MGKEIGLLVGTVIFAVLGVVAAFGFHIYVGMKSNPVTKAANQQ